MTSIMTTLVDSRMDSPSTSDHTSEASPPLKKHHRKRLSGESLTHSHSTHEHRNSHSKRRSKDAGLTHSTSSRELARLLVFEEREIKELQRALFAMTEQLKNERQRADDADRKALDAAYKFRQAENSRVAAELNYSRVNEELRLYKVQLENAQKEIYRAQEVISDVESQRQEAEADAARSRSTARALKEERLMQTAREEGRRLGLQEGMNRGRDLGYQEGRAEGYEQGRESADHIIERVYYDDMDEETEQETEREGGRDRDRDRDRARDREESNSDPTTDRWERPRGYDPRHGHDKRVHEHDMDRGHGHHMGRAGTSSSYDPRRTRFEAPARSDGTYPRPPSVIIPETPDHSVPPSPRPFHDATPSPRPFHDVPPDNWIPDQDADGRIRLPPPHEIQPSPVPSPRLPPARVEEEDEDEEEEEEPVLPIPPPAFEIQHSTSSGSRRHRRRSSSPSSETSGRTSELDLLAAPQRGYASLGRGFSERERERLSVIREGSSVENTPSVSQGTMRTASTPTVVRQPSMTLKERETPPRYAQPPTPGRGEYSRRPRSPGEESVARSISSLGIYRPPSVPAAMVKPPSAPGTRPPSAPGTRPPSAPGTRPPSAPGTRPPSASGGRPPSYPSKAPSFPSTRPPSFPAGPPSFPSGPPSFPSGPPSFPAGNLAEPKPEYRRSRSSSVNSEIEIDIEPPSRPQSNSSKDNAALTGLLSPRDADRPVPLPGESSHHGPPSIPEESVPVFSQLPPGFVATGPPQPDTPLPGPSHPSHPQPSSHAPARPAMPSRKSSGGSRGYTPRTSIYAAPPPVAVQYSSAAPVVPSGFPPMGDQYMSMSTGQGSFRTLDPSNDEEPYIPMPTTMPVIPPPSSNYARYDDETQSTTSSGSSDANTLSTPPARRMRIGKSSRADTDYAYDPAPVPVPDPGPAYAVPQPGGRHDYQQQQRPQPKRRGSTTPRTRPISIYGAAATMNPSDGRAGSAEAKPSLQPSTSYKHFDRQQYNDPALLASASSSVEDVSKVGLSSPGGGRGYGSGRSRR